jgi:predicted nucleotidyltransferase
MKTLEKPATASEAMEIAKAAAMKLRTLGATHILLFGSLAEGFFTPKESDIDIYFEGIPDEKALDATGHLLEEFGEGIIDPIPAQFCSALFKRTILSEGLPL